MNYGEVECIMMTNANIRNTVYPSVRSPCSIEIGFEYKLWVLNNKRECWRNIPEPLITWGIKLLFHIKVLAGKFPTEIGIGICMCRSIWYLFIYKNYIIMALNILCHDMNCNKRVTHQSQLLIFWKPLLLKKCIIMTFLSSEDLKEACPPNLSIF